MKIKIIIEKNKEGQFGRCGFQIVGRNKKHLECYIPKIEKPQANKEEVYVMHSVMKAIIYAKKNLKRLKYILFQVPILPSANTKEWQLMNEFNSNKLPNIKIEYTKA